MTTTPASPTDLSVMPCPFCGGTPWFEGDVTQWHDDHRYVQLSIECCATMTEAIGWIRARDMTSLERDTELRQRLTVRWNTRPA